MRRLIQSVPGWLGAGALLFAALLPIRAPADEEAAADQLEEVVVTAEKRSENLQKTALSIQVYKGEELAQEGKKKIDDIMRGVVGVQAQDNQTGASFAMRGVDTGTAGPPNQNPGATVAILIDGIYQTRAETARSGTLDVSQVEVMRGTQSTNLGASALAGAVSLVSNKPNLDRQEASGTVEFGNYNLRAIEGVYNVPLSSTNALRFAGSLNQRRGYLSSGAGDNDITIGRVKYRWKPNDDFDMVLTVNTQHLGGNGVSAGVLTYEGYWEPYNPLRNSFINGVPSGTCGGAGQPSCYDRVMGYPGLFGHVDSPLTWRDRSDPWDDGYPADIWPNHPFRDTRITQYSADIKWNTSVGTLAVIPQLESARFRSAEPPRGNSWMAENRDNPTEQVEVRFNSPSTSKIDWLAGLYYYHTDQTGTFLTINDPYSVGGPPLLPSCLDVAGNTLNSQECYQWTNDSESSLRTLSAFGQVQFPFTDTFRGLAGVRYSKDKRQVSSTPNAVPGTAVGPTAPYVYASISEDYSDFTYRLGLEYDVRSQSMLYLTYATGYQPGVVGIGGPPPGYFVTPKNTSTQWTLGMKNRFFDNKLQLNFEAFQLKFKDRPFRDPTSVQVGAANCQGPPGVEMIVLTDVNNFCLSPAGAYIMPNQKSEGADIELSFLPTAADRLDMTIEYLKASYGSNPVTSEDVAGLIAAQNAADNVKAAALAAYNALIGSYSGTILQNSPKWSGNLTYEHRFDLPGGSTFTPRVNLAYKAKYWAQGGGPPPAGFSAKNALDNGSVVMQDAYTMWNAFLTWSNSDGRFDLTAYMKNIANKAIQTNLSAEPGSALMAISLDAPRTFGVSLSARL
jgi:iron complex outermembrane receptor protein